MVASTTNFSTRAGLRFRARKKLNTAINKVASDFGKPKSAKFKCVPIDSLKAARRRLKKVNAKQRTGLEASVKRFGALGRILVDEDGCIIDGHVYWEVLKALGYTEVQVAVVDHLSEAEIQALTIALDRLARLSEMDDEVAKAWVTNLYKVDPSLLHFTVGWRSVAMLRSAPNEAMLLASTKLVRLRPCLPNWTLSVSIFLPVQKTSMNSTR